MTVVVPATSANLGPGFDSLGLALSLKNSFSITPARLSSIHISGEGSSVNKIRTDNAFVRIFNQTLSLFDYPKENFKFSLVNQIPISRGLGSSSAVIIGAIYSAFMIAHRPIDHNEILKLALSYEAHPDNITPALHGGFNVAALSKDRLNPEVISQKFEIPSEIKAVVVIPNVSISTRLSRRSLPKKYSQRDAVFNLSRTGLMTAAFSAHKWELLREASLDRLHQKERMKNYPVLFGVQKCALSNGALCSTLSGSGSSFLNICYAEDAPRLKAALERDFSRFCIKELEFDNLGAHVAEDNLESTEE